MFHSGPGFTVCENNSGLSMFQKIVLLFFVKESLDHVCHFFDNIIGDVSEPTLLLQAKRQKMEAVARVKARAFHKKAARTGSAAAADSGQAEPENAELQAFERALEDEAKELT